MKFIILIVAVLVLGLGGGYYFGDRSFERNAAKENSKEGEKNDTEIARVPDTRLLLGVWKSIEDPKFTREFQSDGTVIDRYSGDEAATVEAIWHAFMSPTDEPAPFDTEEGKLYIKILMPEEALFFTLDSVTDTSLQMTYVDGDTLRFTKVR